MTKRTLTDRIIVRCVPSLCAALDKAADRRTMSVSEYVRYCVTEQLSADGILKNADKGAMVFKSYTQ